MQPSQIVKSAYRHARAAGFKGSLKEWSRTPQPNDIADAIAKWRDNKAAQRRPNVSRRSNTGHHDVHNVAVVRSTRHASGSLHYMVAEARGRS